MAGRDPVAERDKVRRSMPTFEEAVKACHTDFKASWSQRQADSFLSSLERHAYPALGKMRIDHIEAGHIRDMLAPIWTKYADMSRKVRGRVTTVLNYAHAKGWRDAEAPFRSVVMGLGRRDAGGNYAAMPYADVPGFIASVLEKEQTVGRLALLFTIYTAARSGEVRKACWDQIDLDRKVWNRPVSIMKSRAAHTVTLNAQALAVLAAAKELRASTKSDAHVFPSRSGTALSDMTLSKILRDANQPFTVHGFRSSFRDWAAEKMPTIPDPVAEAALAHVVPDKVERAYKRAAFLDMRRKLLDAWGKHLAGEAAPRRRRQK